MTIQLCMPLNSVPSTSRCPVEKSARKDNIYKEIWRCTQMRDGPVWGHSTLSQLLHLGLLHQILMHAALAGPVITLYS